jgi:hypothetical protein
MPPIGQKTFWNCPLADDGLPQFLTAAIRVVGIVLN